ncbi:MAG: tetratricopeptide repeat-containing sensor histidine kinase [Prevotellaceae bacterium]|nr:tetratricopeptide repeat-containing sensor histidine kinase [Prevotellaceae bacterium]
MKNRIILLLLLLGATISSRSQDIDSLFAVFSHSSGEKRIHAANQIVEYGFKKEYIDGLVTLKTTDEKASIDATVYDAMAGYYLWEKNSYRRCIDFYVVALENYLQIEHTTSETIIVINGNIGYCYSLLGDFENAVVYMMRCYELQKKVNDDEGLSSTLNDLGVLYSNWKKPDMAIRFFEEAERVERPLNRPMNYANRLAQLAKEYLHIDQGKALQLIKEALQYDERIEFRNLKDDRIATHLLIMGDIYSYLDSLDKATGCYQKALLVFEKNERHHSVANTLLSLGRLQVNTKQVGEAIATLKRCQEIAEKNNYLPLLRDANLFLSEAYSKLEPNALSYFYLKKYTLLNDSIFRETTQSQLNDFQIRYQTAEKQLEIERQQTEIKRQKTRQFIYIGGLTLAGLLLAMLVYIIWLRTRRNRELSNINAIKDKFFSIISHDLKNPAVAQRDALQLLANHADNMDSGTLSGYYVNLLKSANGLVDLLKNLLVWAKIQTGREAFHPIPFDLVAALQPDIDVIQSMAEGKNITFKVVTPQTAIVTGDENMLATVVRNLLVNALKFTEAGGTVTLEILGYTVSITDTGVGMTSDQLENLFRIDRQQTREGTAGEQSSGLGLIVCRDMLHKHGWALHVKSEEGKGSRFWFEIDKGGF